jgi:catechol 2,3-dioxygenase-like lactoylglutathione lyase family enzyme
MMNNVIGFKRVDHIHITVAPDRLEEAKDFYTDVMGLELIERPNHLFTTAGYWFNIGDAQLHIGVEPQIPVSTRHTAFEVEDVNAALKYLKDKVQILEEPVIPGRRRFAFLDPFGNRMELLQMINR